MIKDFLLDKNRNIIAEIKYEFYREFIYKNLIYIHYKGKIISSYGFEDSLKELLKKKKEMIQEGILFTDEIDEKIDRFNLSLKNSNKKILGLFQLNKNIDFYMQAG